MLALALKEWQPFRNTNDFHRSRTEAPAIPHIQQQNQTVRQQDSSVRARPGRIFV